MAEVRDGAVRLPVGQPRRADAEWIGIEIPAQQKPHLRMPHLEPPRGLVILPQRLVREQTGDEEEDWCLRQRPRRIALQIHAEAADERDGRSCRMPRSGAKDGVEGRGIEQPLAPGLQVGGVRRAQAGLRPIGQGTEAAQQQAAQEA